MRSNRKRFSTRALMMALGLFLMLPMVTVSAQAQGGYWGGNNSQRRERRQDRREERRERREERREERQERREERREARRGRDWNDGNGNWGGSYQLRQTALNAGYNNGIEEGRKDRRRGDRYDFRDEGDYQKATEDYSSRLGDRELYRRYFRQGFENGYRSGYNGY